MQLTEDIKHLFHLVRVQLGAPIRRIELDDNQLCALLEVAIGDYAEKVQNWAIMCNWLNMQNQKVITFQNAADYAYAMTMRTFKWSEEYSFWFSKEVGLQQRGPYELKKDFFKVERGKQVYVVPAGREINKVMYVTPSTTKAALYGAYGSFDMGFAGGFGQFGNMNHAMGLAGFYIGNAYDTALMSVDLKYKNSLLRGDLAYKVTAGPEGTHLVHLLSVPGSPNMIGGMTADDSWGWNKFHGCYVWYTYYDLEGADADTVDACRKENKDNIIITPDQVPMSKMSFELMNEPSQNIVRKLLTAEAKITLANIRGMYSGKVSIPEAEMQLDYSMFLEQGKAERETALNDLKERLESMTPWKLMENQANLNDQLLKVLSSKPMPLMVR